MNDPFIRSAFHKTVLSDMHQDDHTIVIDELGLKNGVVRADIAVLNGKLVGYEIKGERDTLTRLGAQVMAYNEVFEYAHIVVAKKYLQKVKAMVPEWWGIYEIDELANGALDFGVERKGETNPARNNYGIAQLLWKDEAAEVLANLFSLKVKKRHTRHELYRMLAETAETPQLASLVLRYLKQREHWRTGR